MPHLPECECNECNERFEEQLRNYDPREHEGFSKEIQPVHCRYCFRKNGDLEEAIDVMRIEEKNGTRIVRQCLSCKMIQ